MILARFFLLRIEIYLAASENVSSDQLEASQPRSNHTLDLHALTRDMCRRARSVSCLQLDFSNTKLILGCDAARAVCAYVRTMLVEGIVLCRNFANNRSIFFIHDQSRFPSWYLLVKIQLVCCTSFYVNGMAYSGSLLRTKDRLSTGYALLSQDFSSQPSAVADRSSSGSKSAQLHPSVRACTQFLKSQYGTNSANSILSSRECLESPLKISTFG